MDKFGQVIPSFNLKGKTHINTYMGGLLTAMILTITLAYAIQTFGELIMGSDPQIYENFKAEYYGSHHGFNISDSNQRFAVSVYQPNKSKDKDIDPRYVTLMAFLEGYGENHGHFAYNA